MTSPVTPGQLGIATPFGELLGNSAAEMERELQDYVEMGVDWVRLDIHWSLVQPRANGGFDWTLVDRVFNAIEAKGLKITAILNNTPNWVNDDFSTKADQEAFGRFAAAAAARYDTVVDHWEILNEQNKAGITPEDYTAVLKQAHAAIKAVDGDDVVITGGTAPVPSSGNGMWGAVEYLERMYAAGAKGHFDAVGFHPYSFPLMPGNNAAWNGWQIMEDGIRGAMLANGDGHKQVWMTEFGAKTAGGGVTVSQGEAAQMLREAVDLAQDHAWAGPIMWFSYQDSSFEPGFGLRDAQGNRRDAYWAFKELANLDNAGTGGTGGSSNGTGTGSGTGSGTGTGTVVTPVTGKTIHDTAGNDVIQGTSSNDVIHSSGGQDSLRGGGGADTFVFSKAGLWDSIGDWAADDTIDLRGIDADTGRAGHQAFTFVGSKWLSAAGDLGVYVDRAHNKTYVQANLDGDKDAEVSIVLNGVHQLDASHFLLGAGTGPSSANGTGTSGTPVTGKTIYDTAGNDVIQGTSGNDVIHSSGGQDSLRGGGGEDTFVFNKAGLWDNIGDWSADDTIDLSGIDANTGRAGQQDFTFVGSKWLSAAGDLGVYVDRAHNKTYVQANLDGDKDVEVSIVLNGVHQLDASHFLF